MSGLLAPGAAFVRGVNLPWLSYGNDFGSSTWLPHGGIGRLDLLGQIDAVFARLAAAGVPLVRWFLLCDGRAGLCENDHGPTGLDDFALRDFETAVSAAEAHGLSLMPVLLDFHWCHPRASYGGTHCGGRAHYLLDSGARAHLLEHVLRPLLAWFGERPGIAAWDLINEPEWVTHEWRCSDSGESIPPSAMRAFIGEAAALVRELTVHSATVGLACPASLPLVRGLGLDLLQAHWYDAFETETPLGTPIATWEPEAPVILGEFPTRGSGRAPRDIEAMARRAGYAGAMAWSLRATDSATDPEAAWRWLEATPPVP